MRRTPSQSPLRRERPSASSARFCQFDLFLSTTAARAPAISGAAEGPRDLDRQNPACCYRPRRSLYVAADFMPARPVAAVRVNGSLYVRPYFSLSALFL